MGIGRLQKHDAVFGIEALFYGSPWRFSAQPFFDADAGQYAEALGFDEDLAFLTFFGADLLSCKHHKRGGTIRRPSRAFKIACIHGVRTSSGASFCELFRCPEAIDTALRILSPYFTNMPAMKTDSATVAFRWSGTGLEGFARCVGEAVQVQAVIPVGAADERQAVRSFMRRAV